jgi:predicted HAD superfamily phosphohydrolase YqeG
MTECSLIVDAVVGDVAVAGIACLHVPYYCDRQAVLVDLDRTVVAYQQHQVVPFPFHPLHLVASSAD